jgi:hypothetical protein
MILHNVPFLVVLGLGLGLMLARQALYHLSHSASPMDNATFYTYIYQLVYTWVISIVLDIMNNVATNILTGLCVCVCDYFHFCGLYLGGGIARS